VPPARRTQPVRRGVGAGARAAALYAVAFGAALAALGACAGITALANGAGEMIRPVPVTPSGLEWSEQARRDALAAGRWDTTRVAAGADAEERGAPDADAPGDDLLRDLDRGTAAYYAGRWRASAAAFARAAALADDRVTKRLSRGAMALASNDRALPYVPGQNERLFIHYYAALAYLRAGATEDAAVEARRMSLLLQRYDGERDTLDVGARAALRYVAGAVFEAAGAANDADVAYRNAAALGARLTDPAPASAAAGDVVVVLERGFVAHRVGERLRVWTARGGDAFASADTLRQQVELALRGNDALWAGTPLPELRLTPADDPAQPNTPAPNTAPPTTSAPNAVPSAPAAARPAAARAPRAAVVPVTPAPAGAPRVVPASTRRPGEPSREQPREPSRTRRLDDAEDDDRRWRLFTLAWPAYRRPAALAPVGGVLVDAAPADTSAAATRSAVPPLVSGDLSLAVASDFKRDRSARLARLVARAALRASLVHSADRTDRSLGDLAAAFGTVVERADTRSWHLLPAEVQVVRLHLAPGTHTLALDAGDHRLALGTVRVQPRTVQVVSARVWDGVWHPDPDPTRVTTAGFQAATP